MGLINVEVTLINLLNPVLPSYRNQSIDLLCKSLDWFLYEGNTGNKWVKRSYSDMISKKSSEAVCRRCS